MSGYYDYDNLVKKALSKDASEEDVNELGEWFRRYGVDYWNGEYYEVDEEYRLYEVFKEVAEDEFELIGYELKRG